MLLYNVSVRVQYLTRFIPSADTTGFVQEWDIRFDQRAAVCP
jgi:hypothetical protein